MLLTGFDSPPVQALFLDRGLRDHGLMQAIARTNRRYPGKDYGVVIDYWGTFDNLKAALKEFASEDLEGTGRGHRGAHRALPEDARRRARGRGRRAGWVRSTAHALGRAPLHRQPEGS